MSNSQNPRPGQTEHNKPSPEPTQKNEAQRTPESRNDRGSHVGGDNQSQSRKSGGPERGAR